MYEPDPRKIYRREKILDKHLKKDKSSHQEQRFITKSKKEKKKQIEHIREQEIWEDWENYH